ncbi:MAG: sulfatase-like hydrolase/transferase [Kiritimatiellae bacterium]|nr:sulfatase-like hydrolase/transferase [Kiritimatiellia bacterium]
MRFLIRYSAGAQRRGRTLRLWLCALWTSAAVAVEAPRPARPNIAFLIADDLGWGDLGVYGARDIATPNLDRLAAEGIRFEAAYVTAPYCAPSRAALLTGRYPTRYGFEFNPTGTQNCDPAIGLPRSEPTLAEALRAVGYATAAIGKWHLGGTPPYHPLRRGFDEFFGFLHEGHFYVPAPWAGHVSWLRRRALPDGSQGRWISADETLIWTTHMAQDEPPYDADNPILRGGQPVEERENLTDAFAREAISFIRRRREAPWFLYLAFNAVHSPMQAPCEWVGRFAHIGDPHRRLYAAMVAHLDAAIGRVLDEIAACGVASNTLVVFLSDNGGATRELAANNGPWRGEKGQLYEGGIRVPMIWRWPARWAGGRVERRMISAMDATATALAVAGARFTGPLDGLDVCAGLDGNPAPFRTNLYWRMGELAGWREGDWKALRERDGRWRLYHLRDDPTESRDLCAEHPEVLERLVAAWSRCDRGMVAPAWK